MFVGIWHGRLGWTDLLLYGDKIFHNCTLTGLRASNADPSPNTEKKSERKVGKRIQSFAAGHNADCNQITDPHDNNYNETSN